MARLDVFPSLPPRLRNVLDDAIPPHPSSSRAASHPADGALLDAYSTAVSAAVANASPAVVGGQDTVIARRIVRHFALACEFGVRVSSVERDSPAASAGIRDGDVIVGFGDAPVTGIDDLHRMLTGGLIGDGVDITILRRDRLLALRVTLLESAQPRPRR